MTKREMIVGALVLAVAGATWLGRPKSVTAQTTYSQPVKVVNTGASQAVPVSGSVTVGNTVPVTVGNTVPVTVGNTVAVSGTVNVSNTPLAVTPGLSGTPVAYSGSCQPNKTWDAPCTALFPDLNPQTTVVEQIGCHIVAANNMTFVGQLTWSTGATQSTLRFPISNMGLYNDMGFYTYAGNLQTRVYISPNTRINLQFFNGDWTGTSAPYLVYCYVSGVLH